jgi:DNA polymerase
MQQKSAGTDGGRCAFDEAYQNERARLLALAAKDDPQGEYRWPVFGEGAHGSKILLIGEAPGAEETRMGRPFVGKAGKQLDALFCRFGVMREEAYITNAVKYRPVVRSEKTARNRTPQPAEVKSALPLLAREIELLRPSLILTLGNTPLKAVCTLAGIKPPVIGEVHGSALKMRIEGLELTLIPLYHPASGIYNRSLVEIMERDAAFVGEFVKSLA